MIEWKIKRLEWGEILSWGKRGVSTSNWSWEPIWRMVWTADGLVFPGGRKIILWICYGLLARLLPPSSYYYYLDISTLTTDTLNYWEFDKFSNGFCFFMQWNWIFFPAKLLVNNLGKIKIDCWVLKVRWTPETVWASKIHYSKIGYLLFLIFWNLIQKKTLYKILLSFGKLCCIVDTQWISWIHHLFFEHRM